ncbi:hypothetical protein NPIL_339791 [Nephila pilipes]|uniref:Uncharacterized protein n=1 Tax=Nephila pilipes TaxID=299642 RepID=A0A8X6JG68_NEPPI|nr:hypothetical protein NPIL_339791 [Nephila pilipes]
MYVPLIASINIGERGVGKSTLAQRLGDIEGPLYDESTEILKSNFHFVVINLAELNGSIRDGKYLLNIHFDPAPIPDTFPPINYYNYEAFLFCLDVNNRLLIRDVEQRARNFREHFVDEIKPPSVLVGTKIDLRNQNPDSISTPEGRALALRCEIDNYVRCSAWNKRGERGVGKSTLVKRLGDIEGPLYDESTEILKSNFHFVVINLAELNGSIRNGKYLLDIHFDPAPFPDSFPPINYHNYEAFLFCLDVNNRLLIGDVEQRVIGYGDYFTNANEPPTALVGTKIDLNNNNPDSISTAEGRALATELEINPYIECSAWNKSGTMRLFYMILYMLNLWEDN